MVVQIPPTSWTVNYEKLPLASTDGLNMWLCCISS